MKKLLFMLFSALCVATVLVSCSSDDNDNPYGIQVVPNVRLNLAATRTADEAHLSPKQIARWGNAMYLFLFQDGEWKEAGRGFGAIDRDMSDANPALLMRSSDIVYYENDEYHLRRTYLDDAKDMVITRAFGLLANGDTIWVDPLLDLKNNNYPENIDWKKDIVKEGRDTIAYISNSTVKAIAKDITEKWNEGDIDAVNKIFKERFIFTPINAKEWRALKAKGEQ
ncbi:MAG: hypothetical protein K5854_09655 [Prevotella sp.]|nr:hypothetical protein [Prevotella sp.]